ncbi:hypothetical protein [Actinoalloteichus fjordicus]|uniref:hypothetical protein n=1 Tax=Actinoalloteichus fjordicus TaxID=1612552 RepID=UPI0012F7D314|nr:hypothetical protein [Actinoalloteichus fjordicus]
MFESSATRVVRASTSCGVADLLSRAGNTVTARMVREPDERWDRVPQAYLLATKSGRP